jgi:hypothetical protein
MISSFHIHFGTFVTWLRENYNYRNVSWEMFAYKQTWGNLNYTPTHREGAILQSPCPSIRSHFRNRYLSFYLKKWFYFWYMALTWWLVPCLPFPGLPHIYFLFTVRLRIFHVCRNENFRNSYFSFYWKKWFYIWYMALAWWLVPCLPFPGLLHIYFLFTMRLTNERVGVFLARRSMQYLVWIKILYKKQNINYNFQKHLLMMLYVVE